MRDLQDDKHIIGFHIQRSHKREDNLVIAMHAIDRAIAAEKERDELRKRVEDGNNLLLACKSHINAGYPGFALIDINEYLKHKEPTP